ncbi:MAG: hypothetical protein AAB385_00655 [Planctomycetota bacterium]
MTFSDPATQEFLSRNFVCAKVNLVPGLLLGNASHHSEELLAQFPEGGGGGNVRSVFCTPDGRIISEVKGFWRPERYLDEAERTRSVASASREEVVAFHEKHVLLHTLERQVEEADRAKLTEPEPKPSPSARRIAALNRMRRSHEESIELIHVPVETYLDRIADEVWTKGNVG